MLALLQELLFHAPVYSTGLLIGLDFSFFSIVVSTRRTFMGYYFVHYLGQSMEIAKCFVAHMSFFVIYMVDLIFNKKKRRTSRFFFSGEVLYG